MCEHYGYGFYGEVPLLRALESNPVEDVYWALRSLHQQSIPIAFWKALAGDVLAVMVGNHILEGEYPLLDELYSQGRAAQRLSVAVHDALGCLPRLRTEFEAVLRKYFKETP